MNSSCATSESHGAVSLCGNKEDSRAITKPTIKVPSIQQIKARIGEAIGQGGLIVDKVFKNLAAIGGKRAESRHFSISKHQDREDAAAVVVPVFPKYYRAHKIPHDDVNGS